VGRSFDFGFYFGLLASPAAFIGAIYLHLSQTGSAMTRHA
jgi:hypothetical protein